MINQVVISGNLTADPDRRGSRVLAFTVAVNERVRDRDGNYSDRAHFFNVVKFGTENAIDYFQDQLRKGMKITVSGKLSQNRWEQDGQQRQRVEIVAYNMDFFHQQNRQQNNQNRRQESREEFDESSYYNDDQPSDGGSFGSVYSDENPVDLDPY